MCNYLLDTVLWGEHWNLELLWRTCACTGRIPSLHFSTLFPFPLRGKSGLQSSGAGWWWWCMTGKGPFPSPPCPQAEGAPAVPGSSGSRRAQHFLGSACQRLFLRDGGWLISAGGWRACGELWRGRELGQKGCWDRNAWGKPQLKFRSEYKSMEE